MACPPGGYSKSGSLTLTADWEGTISAPLSGSGSLPSSVIPVYGAQFTVVGGGGLAGVAGTGSFITIFGGATDYIIELQLP